MSREAIAELVDRWLEDPAFRAAVRQDPEGAVRATGVELDEDEWAAVRAVDWSLSDDELATRASKGGCGTSCSGMCGP